VAGDRGAVLREVPLAVRVADLDQRAGAAGLVRGADGERAARGERGGEGDGGDQVLHSTLVDASCRASKVTSCRLRWGRPQPGLHPGGCAWVTKSPGGVRMPWTSSPPGS